MWTGPPPLQASLGWGAASQKLPTTPRGCWQEPRFLATWATLSAWCCHLGLPPQAVMREEARRQLYLVLEVTHLRRQDGRRPESPGRPPVRPAPWGRPGNAAGWLPSQTSRFHLKVHSSFNELILHFCQESVVQICGFISVSLFCPVSCRHILTPPAYYSLSKLTLPF